MVTHETALEERFGALVESGCVDREHPGKLKCQHTVCAGSEETSQPVEEFWFYLFILLGSQEKLYMEKTEQTNPNLLCFITRSEEEREEGKLLGLTHSLSVIVN